MPLYGAPSDRPGLLPGQNLKLFDAETPSAAQSSICFARLPAPGEQIPSGIVFTFGFASSPTAVITIQGSNDNADGDYQTLYTSTDSQQDYYADAGTFGWYRAHCTSYSAGGALTVLAQR